MAACPGETYYQHVRTLLDGLQDGVAVVAHAHDCWGSQFDDKLKWDAAQAAWAYGEKGVHCTCRLFS